MIADPVDLSLMIAPVYFAGFILVGLGILLFLFGRHLYREGTLAAKMPESPLNNVPAGLVRVRGKAVGAEPLLSPLARVPCFYYALEVQKLQKSDGQENWEEFSNETDQRSFFLDDGSSRVAIDPEDAEWDFPRTLYAEIGPQSAHSWFVDNSLSVPRLTEQQLYAFLASDWQKSREALQSSGILGAGAAQKILAVGQTMASLGLSVDVDGTEVNPSHAGESFRFTETCLLAGREYTVIGTTEKNAAATGATPAATIHKGKEQKTFFITANTGAQVGSRPRRNGLIMMLVGAALVAGMIFLMIARARG